MELREALRHRKMVRAFTAEPISTGVLERVLWASSRAPSAGNAQGTDLVVLQGPDETARYWDLCLPPAERDGFPWPDLLAAPVLVVAVAHAGAYVERYAEPDKAPTGLGAGADAWPVPYWLVDTSFAVMNLLLAAVDEGLGALFFGLFDHERALLDELGVPADRRAIGTVAIGHPAPDRPSRSAGRSRRGVDEIVHRGGW